MGTFILIGQNECKRWIVEINERLHPCGAVLYKVWANWGMKKADIRNALSNVRNKNKKKTGKTPNTCNTSISIRLRLKV